MFTCRPAARALTRRYTSAAGRFAADSWHPRRVTEKAIPRC
jgi:hypothetical protein